MIFKKIIALRNKAPELVVFERIVKESFVFGKNLRYIYDSSTLDEAAYHIWLWNEVFKKSPVSYQGNYEICLRLEKKQEDTPPVYKVVLLCEGRYIAELFDLDIREAGPLNVQKGLEDGKLPENKEAALFLDLLQKTRALAMPLKYTRDSTSIEEAAHSVWMFNSVLDNILSSGLLGSQYRGFEIWLTAEKELERSPISFSALLLYNGRIIATLFRNIGIIGVY